MRMAANSEKTVKPRGPGKPFPKGKTGNPSGRPKRTTEELDLIAACKDKTPDALAVIASIMGKGENERNRLAAALAIIERGYGKTPQGLELTGKNGGPMETVTRVELVALDGNGAN